MVMKMNKKTLKLGIITICLSIIISLFAFIPINRLKTSSPTIWMDKVSDETKITDLSIPGTHDSGATRSIFDVAGKCQDLSINAQLNIGVRFFDLRLQLVNNQFKIVHSFVDQKLTFKKVLKDLTSFIKNHPSEFLIISIKEEESSINSTKYFEEAFLESIENYKDIFCTDNQLPEKLIDARGKIYILSRFTTSIGIPAYNGWKDSDQFNIGSIYVQDRYSVDSVQEKIDYINTGLSVPLNNDILVLNFLSCYLNNSFPPTYAGPPAVKINKYINEYLENNKDKKVGILICDFITYELSKNIYERNYQYENN